MKIGAVNNYADLFRDTANNQAKEIKQAALMEELGLKVAMASINADSIMSSFGGWELDSSIPEDSTVSFHV